ncbi:hypothetical protein NSK11_contig00059-0004 [Nocardia seriolae]|uniref:Alpha/beta hydrolase n=1 Tax=Nocardia seriolae TaxID=37332 RepID=A0ABC9YW22_9NOCA|nr:hypothetical protein NSERKGN1266_11260 [Nocardia seriolae]BEK98985.1 hypothetical protein NSER024013_68910 [Nocardia seriolae]GAM47741.1 hypothetical protein NS07_v2contig00056-0049 [Nocardia seriolae]GAP29559.1 hypothetical protein NSK11_contig00059-0004 [Nocardia seriolae]GEM25182.1 hypothetical protein NS2_34210 [Nocardia seriolae NBRC 15557]
MQIISEKRFDNGVLEREFTLGEIPGILWTPESVSTPAPLILLGHPGGLQKMYPRLAGRGSASCGGGVRVRHHRTPLERCPTRFGSVRAGSH